MNRSTWLHLRIPFSFFLMPVYAFALSRHPHATWADTLLLWSIWHLLVFPASNGYNSYYDRDTESIGGLKNPPPVDRSLWWVSIGMDIAAILLSLLLAIELAVAVFVYGLASKAYSHPAIRLKKNAIWSTAVTVLFQGAVTYWGCAWALGQQVLYSPRSWAEGALASMLILGAYPITQVYQHREDARRGDRTLSLLLGIRGTFLFSATVFAMTGMGFVFYFYWTDALRYFGAFLICLLPIGLYFFHWARQVWRNPEAADFERTMRLNQMSAGAMILFFMGVWLWERFQ